MSRDEIAHEEEQAHLCEHCHEEPSVWLYDDLWLCDRCRQRHEAKVASEEIPDKARKE